MPPWAVVAEERVAGGEKGAIFCSAVWAISGLTPSQDGGILESDASGGSLVASNLVNFANEKNSNWTSSKAC